MVSEVILKLRREFAECPPAERQSKSHPNSMRAQNEDVQHQIEIWFICKNVSWIPCLWVLKILIHINKDRSLISMNQRLCFEAYRYIYVYRDVYKQTIWYVNTNHKNSNIKLKEEECIKGVCFFFSIKLQRGGVG